jgi:hypothetical protein
MENVQITVIPDPSCAVVKGPPRKGVDWLNDKSVLECEAQCRRAGLNESLKMGDVGWDIAAGDEGDWFRMGVIRELFFFSLSWMVTTHGFLQDLDHTYSSTGELPKYAPTPALHSWYFHSVIRRRRRVAIQLYILI